MKKLIVGLAGTAVLAMSGTAVAQVAPEPLAVQIDGKVSPSKGGKKKKPKNAALSLSFTANPGARKTVSRISYLVPANVKLSGRGFKYCPASTINGQGEAACPKGSKVGTGTATAVLGPNQTPLDFTVNVYAGGRSALALALKGTVDIAFEAPISRAGSPYGQRIDVAIPQSVQTPAPSLYSYITGVDTTIKGKVTKGKGKRRRTSYFASLTGCPKDRTHDVGVQLTTVANDAGPAGVSEVFTSQVPCR